MLPALRRHHAGHVAKLVTDMRSAASRAVPAFESLNPLVRDPSVVPGQASWMRGASLRTGYDVFRDFGVEA